MKVRDTGSQGTRLEVGDICLSVVHLLTHTFYTSTHVTLLLDPLHILHIQSLQSNSTTMLKDNTQAGT